MSDRENYRLQGIRGATTVAANDAAQILGATDELLRHLIESNGLEPDDIVSGIFTVTSDLDAAFPARAAEDYGWNIVALLHSTEIPVPGSLPRCIRLLVHAYTTRPRSEIRHIYLRDAVGLRPDRAGTGNREQGTGTAGRGKGEEEQRER